MDARLLVPLLALSSACIQLPEPDYRSSNGVAYEWHGSEFDTALIEEQENWFLERLFNLDYDPREVMEKISHVRVWVEPEPIPCPGTSSKTGKCNGLTEGYRLRVLNMGCPFNSALTHEIGHVLVYDADHRDLGFWMLADGAPRACP